MKHFLIAIAASASIASTVYAADTAVSVSVGQPGFYGLIDIGGYPQPQVIYRQPKVIEIVPVERTPIYLRVPPGHAKHWRKHCHQYNACGERVYFVQDSWYEQEYAPRYQQRHGNHQNNDKHDSGEENWAKRGNEKNGHKEHDNK